MYIFCIAILMIQLFIIILLLAEDCSGANEER